MSQSTATFAVLQMWLHEVTTNANISIFGASLYIEFYSQEFTGNASCLSVSLALRIHIYRLYSALFDRWSVWNNAKSALESGDLRMLSQLLSLGPTIPHWCHSHKITLQSDGSSNCLTVKTIVYVVDGNITISQIFMSVTLEAGFVFIKASSACAGGHMIR